MGTVHQGFCKLHVEDATNARAGGGGGAAEDPVRFLELSSWDPRVQQHNLDRAVRQGCTAVGSTQIAVISVVSDIKLCDSRT
jgi:hypothetical protein